MQGEDASIKSWPELICINAGVVMYSSFCSMYL
jgi:hypothetical protein